jgi:threonyl-tRNA synthetase
MRVGELGLVHRHEASGALNGLFRVRTFTQDDAHIFMTEDQMESEIINLIGFFDRIYKIFNLDYAIELSTRPEDHYIGAIETWNKAEKILGDACHHAGKEFQLNPGDGAFYGPKLDFHIKDSLGRTWQCGTIQLDMNLPERFDLTYVAENGEKKRPVMLHRVIFGSVERFIGILIEHYAGAFPLWLSPVQINVIPVNNEFHLDYASKIKNMLDDYGFRVELDSREEKLGYKMRESQTRKIPYTLIIGDKELNNNTISYRKYGSEETVTLDINEFILQLNKEVSEKNKR